MKKIYNLTLEDYCKNEIEEMKKEKFDISPEFFRSEYYDIVCSFIRNGWKISKRVYDSIPDLHYWIDKHYLIHGNNIIA